jgi:dTDP-4-dehydrorhamnose reductase
VTGAGGLVGRAVTNHCAAEGDEVNAFDHKSLDIADDESFRSVIAQAQPEVVINCAAWTDVDGCESDPDRAQRVNANGPEALASVCREVDALFITISTDYVFDGRKDGFYTQQDQPNPISVYGQSKLNGEIRALQASERTIVVRSGYIFGVGGKNFLSTFLERAKAGNNLKAISDTVGTPTYARDLARRLRRLALMNLPGTYHVVNSGEGVSFERFARTAIEIANLDASLLQSVTLAELNLPARRPRNSRLRCLLSEELGLDPLPDWQDALRHFVDAKSTDSQKAVNSGLRPS